MEREALSNLRAQYAEYASEYLLQLALTAFTDLVPEARGVLAEELERRQLVPALRRVLVAPTRKLSRQELTALVTLVQRSPCPLCGTTRTLLNGVHRRTRSRWAIVVTVHEYVLVLGCQPCLEKVGFRSKELGPGEHWAPTAELVSWVEQNAVLLDAFQSNAQAVSALVRFDIPGFLSAIEQRAF